MKKFANPEVKVEKLDFSVDVVTNSSTTSTGSVVDLPPHFENDE